MDKEKAKQNLERLVTKFKSEFEAGKTDNYTEEETKAAFITPLLCDVLGWDVTNRDEVTMEHKTSRGRVDYGIKLNNKIIFFVEAKPIRYELENAIPQAVKYCFNRKDVPFVLLTDFEGIMFFDATVKPELRNIKKGIKINLKWNEYTDKFDELWQLSKPEVIAGSLEKLFTLKPKDRVSVDKTILSDLENWRESLAKNLYRNNKNLFYTNDREKDAQFLKEIMQKILDRIIFIRFCEDRQLTQIRPIKQRFDERGENVGINAYIYILSGLFREYETVFNSDLFKSQDWERDLFLDFKDVNKIIQETYDPYMFDVIPIEVLGNIYEQYLGYTIKFEGDSIKYEPKPEVRKAGGIYYTPAYIVDYIVKNTVGKLLEELPETKIKKLRILDPACGSGSFLIRAYEEMLKYYEKLKKNVKTKIIEGQTSIEIPEAETKLTIQEKAEILKNHIFGVDIDDQAVEVTKLSLMLKMLEGEWGFVKGTAVLPMLDKNIKCGNSLVWPNALELKTISDKDTISILNQTNEYFEIYKDETKKVNDYLTAIRYITLLVPQVEDTFLTNHIFPLFELTYELESSIQFCKLGFYKHAISTLRNVLELGLLSIYWNREDKGHVEIEEWIHSRDFTPKKNIIFNKLKTNKNIIEFDKLHKLFDQTNQIYEQLCNFVHTKGAKFSSRQFTIGGNNFNLKFLKKWLDLYCKTVNLILIFHLLKYPVGLQFTPIDEKFGLDVPMSGFLAPWQVDSIAKLLDSDIYNTLKKISDNDSEAIELAQLINTRQNITDEKYNAQMEKHDKLSIEMCGYKCWIKHEGKFWKQLRLKNARKFGNTSQCFKKLEKWAKDNCFYEDKTKKLHS